MDHCFEYNNNAIPRKEIIKMSDLTAHEHEHDHGHPHDHDHCYNHTHEGMDAKNGDETIALLNYMIEHNKHHGEDLHEIYHSLEAAGKKEAADLVHEAMHMYDHGNEKLAEALKLIGG